MRLTWAILLALAASAAAVGGVVPALGAGGAAPRAAGGAPRAADYYVAPDGRDDWTGKLLAANDAGTDGPLATVQKALELARASRGERQSGATVLLREGTYYLAAPIAIGPEDSGTAEAPTRVAAFEAEHPRLVGGRPLTGWKPYRDGIWQSDLKALGLAGARFRQLFCNGERQVLARRPNLDPDDPHGGKWAYVEAAVETGSKSKFRYAEGDMRAWQDASSAELFFYHAHNYYNTIVRIASVDPGTRVATLAADTYEAIVGEGAERYYVQNLLEELDAPGEWYLDGDNSVVYFMPPASVAGALDQAVVEVPLLDNIIRLEPDTEHVVVQGLTIEVSRATAVELKGARDCLVAATRIAHTGVSLGIGGWGPWENCCGIGIFEGSNNGAVGNDVFDTGGHGIKLTGGDRKTLTPAGNYAENNYIHHTGVYWAQGCGTRLEGVGNRFSRNLVHDCPRMGIIFGGNEHIIEYNHLYDLNKQTCDTGAIYTGGRDWINPRGCVIRYNYIHDIGGYGRQGGQWVSPAYSWGIYLDDLAAGVDVIGNIVVGGLRGNIHLHNARDCLIENNVLVDGVQQQIEFNGWTPNHPYLQGSMDRLVKTYEEYAPLPAWARLRNFPGVHPRDAVQMAGNQVVRNIFYYSDAGAALYKHGALPLEESVFDYNVVYHFDRPVVTGMQAMYQIRVDEGARELAGNGGFEDGTPGAMPEGWGWYIRPNDKAQAGVSDEAPHSGAHCLRIEASSGVNAQGQKQYVMVKSVNIPVQKGHGYRLSAWIKADRPGRTAGIVAQSYRANQHHWAYEQTFGLTEEWKEYSLDVRVPEDIPTLEDFYIRLDFRHDDGVFWVDDVSLKEGVLVGKEKTEWEAWRDRGLDTHSVIADPLFVAPERGDYRLRPDSPALKVGFQPIDFARIGPYEDPLRASWPIAAKADEP